MTTQKIETYSIANGPSKFDLMLALMVWKPAHPQVEFTLNTGTTIVAHISSIEAEDGSGESWNIKCREHAFPNGPWQQAEIYFRTDDRRGFLKAPADC